jgi:TolB-like protein
VLLTGDEVQAPITSATAVPLAIPEIPSIAVLPFDNMSADPEQEYFSDGITEDILTDLSKLSGLLVISRHSTFVYKGKSVSAQQISRDLGVRYVLEGSVRKAGNRIRITAQLIDATIDDHIWADRFDRELEDIFALQDEVSRIIVDALKLNLTDLEEQRLGHKGTDNIMAHDYLIQAREQFFLFTPKGITNALELCSHAIEIDPNYAEVYALKSRLLIFPYAVSANLTLEETVIPAVVSAKKAIELDDLLPLAHASLGWALMWNREIEVAISEGKRAVTLDPNFADGHMWLSLIYSSAGKGDEALESIEKAVRLNPYYGVVYLFAHGLAYFVLGQYEKALSFFTKGIEDSPNYVPLYIFRTGILGLLDRKEEAHSSADELVKLSPHYNGYVATIFNDKQMMETLDKGFKKAGLETQIRNFKI